MVCVTTRERVLLRSTVFFRALGTVPYRIRLNITNGHDRSTRENKKAGAAERASLGEGEGRGRGGIDCYGKGSIRERGLRNSWVCGRGTRLKERHGTGALGNRARTDVALGLSKLGAASLYLVGNAKQSASSEGKQRVTASATTVVL